VFSPTAKTPTQCASLQFFPIPASTLSGTDRLNSICSELVILEIFCHPEPVEGSYFKGCDASLRQAQDKLQLSVTSHLSYSERKLNTLLIRSITHSRC